MSENPDAMVWGTPEASDAADALNPDDSGMGGDDGADSFDRALSQYDTAVPKQAPASAEELPEEPQVEVDEILSQLPSEIRAKLETDYVLGLHHLQGLAQQVAAERDRQDVQRLFDTLKRDFPEVSERVVRAMLTDTYYTNERAAQAWRDRYQSPAVWSREVNRIKAELAVEARSRIDPDASDTVAAVNAAVMRFGSAGPREPTPVNYNAMTDKEFAAHLKQEYGFTPRLD